MKNYIVRIITLTLAAWILGLLPLRADWPAWGGNPDHTFWTEGTIPSAMTLNWKRQLHSPDSAWPKSQGKLQFDDAHGIVIMGELVLVNSAVTDSLTAYNLTTGKKVWSFQTNEPVRFSPVVHQDRVYLGSDDGYLYCLNLKTGKEYWRLRGGPDDRRILGNERLISMWPVRGAPVVKDNVVYYAAGIWPVMGVLIHAVDAGTGKQIWLNSSNGSPINLIWEHLSQSQCSRAALNSRSRIGLLLI